MRSNNLKDQWEHWAGEAHNALIYLRGLQEEIERKVEEKEAEDEDYQPPDSIQNALDLSIQEALDTAAEADDDFDLDEF